MRQKVYTQTKSLKQLLIKCEDDIIKLEKLKSSLEVELSEPLVFSNPLLAKEKNNEYESIKIS